MDNKNSDDLPESINEVIDTLTKVKEEIFDSIITLLLDGECKPPPNRPLGETYPYDYKLYAKESFDPNVQLLNKLIASIDDILNKLTEIGK